MKKGEEMKELRSNINFLIQDPTWKICGLDNHLITLNYVDLFTMLILCRLDKWFKKSTHSNQLVNETIRR